MTGLGKHSIWLRLMASTLLVGAALGMTQMIWLIVDRPISSPLFLGAIVVSGWLCGWRWGVYSTVLSAFLIDFFFVQPIFKFTGDFDEIARLAVFTVEGAGLCWLIEVRRRAIDETLEAQEELRALSSHQQSLREEEQKRISLEIHDELGQALTGLKMEARLLEKGMEKAGGIPTALTRSVGDLSGHIDATIATVRRIATELRPSVLDDLGLIAAIDWQAAEFRRRSGVTCNFSSEQDSLEISSDESTAVFRIVQEALTNIGRHAKASRVDINVGNVAGSVTVSVVDDGVGIDLASVKQKPSLGILGMRERARLIGAALDISNGSGTTVVLTLPGPSKA